MANVSRRPGRPHDVAMRASHTASETALETVKLELPLLAICKASTEAKHYVAFQAELNPELTTNMQIRDLRKQNAAAIAQNGESR